jgi:hypothetical protein
VRHRLPWWLATVLLGCAMTPPQVGDPGPQLPDSKAENAYRAVLDRFTDRREVYDGVETQLFTGATYQSAAFREARVRRKAAFQLWPEGQLEQAQTQEKGEAAQFHEVVFGVRLPDGRFDDFDGKQSIWRLSLSTAQGEVTPLSVRRIGRADPNTRAYYPYMGDFWTVYSARFPLQVGGQPLTGPGMTTVTFRMASTQARVEMQFPVQ